MSDHPQLFSPFATRLYVAILLMIGLFCTNSMRSSLGMAMVCMVNASVYHHNDQPSNHTSTITKQPFVILNNPEKTNSNCDKQFDTATLEAAGYQGSLEWSPRQQSLLFSAPFFGGLLTMLPSGYIADRFGPKWTFFFAAVVFVCCSLVTPTLAMVNYFAFLAVRFLMGLGEGFVMPSIAALVCRWFPATERSTATAIYTSGNQLSNIFSTLMAAQLCTSHFLGGWPAIFYSLGTFGIIWLALWSVFGSNTPLDHKFIRERERAFLTRKSSYVPRQMKKHIVPWRQILTSPAIYANFLAMFAAFFGGGIIATYSPTYFRDVLKLDLKTNGVFNAIPYVVQLVVKMILGPLSDILKKREILTGTAAVRLFQGIASFGAGGVFFCLAFFVDCTRPTLALGLIMLMAAANAATIPGVLTSLLCIAPAHTGLLQAMAQLFGTLAAAICPLFVGAINQHGTLGEWQMIYISVAVLTTLSGIVYSIFGSGEQQDWALPTTPPPSLSPFDLVYPVDKQNITKPSMVHFDPVNPRKRLSLDIC